MTKLTTQLPSEQRSLPAPQLGTHLPWRHSEPSPHALPHTLQWAECVIKSCKSSHHGQAAVRKQMRSAAGTLPKLASKMFECNCRQTSQHATVHHVCLLIHQLHAAAPHHAGARAVAVGEAAAAHALTVHAHKPSCASMATTPAVAGV